MRSLLFVVVVMLTGCSAKYPEGKLACAKQSDCPSDWVCRVDRYCYANGAKAEAAAGEEASAGSGGAAGGLGILKRL